MKKWTIPVLALMGAQTFFMACKNGDKQEKQPVEANTEFQVEAEEFADLKLLRYQIPGFEELSAQQKELAYYLYEAALCGRDIIYDQKSKNGLLMRKTIEAMYGTYKGDKNSADWKKFEEYCGRFWFSNGNHHHYGNEKFIPECSYEYFAEVAKNSDAAAMPVEQGENIDAFLVRVKPLFYDLNVEPKVVDQRPNIDNVVASSNNFYEGVTQKRRGRLLCGV